MRAFLKRRCGLDNARPIPGRLVTHHHEAYFFWRELVRGGALSTPFDVVHVDAHADLGTGDAGYVNLMTDVLHRPVERRADVERAHDRLNAGNYLAFAAACRWVRSLLYVANPAARDDLMYLHFKNFDAGSGLLAAQGVRPARSRRDLHARTSRTRSGWSQKSRFGRSHRRLPVRRRASTLPSLCQSPGFTPSAV